VIKGVKFGSILDAKLNKEVLTSNVIGLNKQIIDVEEQIDVL